MKEYSKYYTIITFKKRDYISIAVLSYNKSSIDSKYIFGKVFNINKNKPDYYQIITLFYFIKKKFPLLSSIFLKILNK